ncbi:MAG: DNA alkylation repair protein [Candidatus Kapaibacteriales bacterium]
MAKAIVKPNYEEVMKYLESKANPDSKHILMRHGAEEPFYNVRVADLKPLVKKIKKDYELSKKLWDSGVSDAMYLAGLIADEEQMTKSDFEHWIDTAYWYMLSECAVAWPAAEHRDSLDFALEWIESENDRYRQVGWATLSGIIALKDKELPDTNLLSKLLDQVGIELQGEENRVKYVMNGFVIAVGGYIPELRAKAEEVAKKVGKVEVDMGGTACKVPEAVSYIGKMYDRNQYTKRKKTVRC